MCERGWLTVLVGVWLGFVPTLLAQSATPPGARKEASTGKPPATIYVPWEELDRLLTDDEPGVLISREEFDQLLTASRSESGLEAAQPAGISAEYRGRIEAEFRQLSGSRLGMRLRVRDADFWRGARLHPDTGSPGRV